MFSPDQHLGILFHDVQTSGLFPDSKTFVDAISKENPYWIVAQYEQQKNQPDFDLGAFVKAHFELPHTPITDFITDASLTTAEHIDRLWPYLTRPGDPAAAYAPAGDPLLRAGDSQLPLPRPYVVPGGRFRELFYWDTYFTMLGLRESGHGDLIRDMLENFAYLIDTYGHIPNGNRTYFLSRSQPPFFALMVQVLAEIDGPEVLIRYLPQLEKERGFWMRGAFSLVSDKEIKYRVNELDIFPNSRCEKRSVFLTEDDTLLNRYWDSRPTPRPESYRQELDLFDEAGGDSSGRLFEHIRAACESGWDFSSRWFADGQSLSTIQTANYSPVDLACLLYSLEKTLQLAYEQAAKQPMTGLGHTAAEFNARAVYFNTEASMRATRIQSYCWNDETGFFHDYDFVQQALTPALTLAGVFPMFMNVATPEQASRVHDRLKADFLQAGGWVTTLVNSGQQWDWPNGWAPLQWIVYKGLLNYGFTETAYDGRDRWLALNDRVFRATGKLMEKYNVVDNALTAGGGEYPNQDGFGWTNGVYLALQAAVNHPR